MAENKLLFPEEKINIFKKFHNETPCYVLFEKEIINNINYLKSFPKAFNFTIRYAMKANSNISLLKLINKENIKIDASSINECYRALKANIKGQDILLTSQEVPDIEELKELLKHDIQYNATSLYQLETYGKVNPNSNVSIRFNIGIGSGWNCATSTGGENSSFGIYKQKEEIKYLLNKYNLNLIRIHIHIGSGSDPEKQKLAGIKSIELLKEFESVKILNLGGGMKIARTEDEKEVDIKELGEPIKELLINFYNETNRKIDLEIEPGTAIIGNQGYIISKIIDIVTTGKYNFIKINSGMIDNSRIAMYGAQHPIKHIPLNIENNMVYNNINKNNKKENKTINENINANNSIETKEYVIVGSCCESGDIITCERDKPEKLRTIKLTYPKISDLIIIGGSGAYCSSMSVYNYNSKQKSPEFLITSDNQIKLIRKKQKLEDIWKDEINL